MEQQPVETPSAIGPYGIVQSLGRGGMGEVYLAKDPICGRQVALKRIRPELKDNKTIQSRFLKEARVASALTHPSIVPILSIHTALPDIYYTMPFVEGDTLRQILRQTREQEKSGESLHLIGRSIPSLARIFLQVCEAIAYTHAKGILHRDLKPENIIVGKYGEVMILDWGIADFIDQIGKEEPLRVKKLAGKNDELTRPGKIAGTLAYMAPERLSGKSSSAQTDLYALGVILYQMLTLQLPFQRQTIASFRKQLHAEELIDPIEMAPYRDIPHQLAALCNKCLAKAEESRYSSVEALIADLKKYIEGRAEWMWMADLDLNRKEDWQFQENILLAKHIAITSSLDVTEWAALMISRRAFTDNVRIEAQVRLGPDSQGIGFLLSVPEADERKSLEEGYCLWLGSAPHPSCRLFRRNVQVIEAKGVYLQPKVQHHIRIEKIEDHVKFYLDGQLKLSFASHLPLVGKHVGFLQKDADFELKHLKVYGGSLNAMVGCLAVPNAFFSHRHYDVALQEYRRIGQCFPGRMEGREALFRAGITLLEKGKAEKEEKYFHLALKEFEKLYHTPGGPLEYLGKSLVYEALNDSEEEAKCLELALRKFPKHPLLPMLREHTVYRMHESSINNREAAYRIILLAIRHIPDLLENPDTRELLDSLQGNWEPLPFIEESPQRLPNLAIQLAFRLGKVPILIEIARELSKQNPLDETLLGNALFSLIELDAGKEISQFPNVAEVQTALSPMDTDLPKKFTKREFRALHFLLRQALMSREFGVLAPCFEALKVASMDKTDRIAFDAIEVWYHLLQKRLKHSEAILRKHPSSTLTQETSPLHFPFGAWLYLAKGPKTAKAHFASVLETPYPPTTALPSHFLAKRIDEKKGWIERAFWWEKKELYRQLELFYRAVGKK
jgi:serine/threonine-protein kinase